MNKLTLFAVVVFIGVVGFLVFSNRDAGKAPIDVNFQNNPSGIPTLATSNPSGTPDAQSTPVPVPSATSAVIKTDKGDIAVELYPQDAPIAVYNFVELAKKNYYNNITFHRVDDWVIQAGDPTGTGRGGESIFGKPFQDELNPDTPSYKAGYLEGTLAMANSGPNTNGSQFFILTKDYPLDHAYTIFGKVTSGMDIVKKIAVGDKILGITAQ